MMQDESQNDMSQLNANYDRIMDNVQKEIYSLQTMIDDKNEELGQQIKDKTNQREYYEMQVSQLVAELEAHKQNHHVLEREKDIEISSLEDNIQTLVAQGDQL